jgi:hypothetical protein
MTAFHSLLSVIQLCAAALAEDKEQVPAWGRKGYVWRKLGKVLPDGVPYTRGNGASKRYATSAIPIIAVLLYISNRFAPVEILDAISRALQRNLAANRAFSQCWAAALARTEATDETGDEEVDEALTNEAGAVGTAASETTWLTVSFPTIARDGFIVRCSAGPETRRDEDVDIYCLDLDFVFWALLEVGRQEFGETFRLTSARPQGRRA